MLSKKGILVRRNDFTTCKLVSQLVYKVLYRVVEGSFEIHDNRDIVDLGSIFFVLPILAPKPAEEISNHRSQGWNAF